MQDIVTNAVVALFAAPGVALILSGVILGFALWLIFYSGFTEYKSLKNELTARWNLLTSIRGKTTQEAFFLEFQEIDKRFSHNDYGDSASASLVLGWSNYRSLLADTGKNEFAIAIRAEDAFERIDEPARSLEWWSNILVAIGLAITFLGIVAALSETTASMNNGNAAAMQSAIVDLLAIAATKFWTSIAGVVASIILRIVARQRRKRLNVMHSMMFEALDRCASFMPVEKVMLEHLNVLERIDSNLQRFVK